MSSPLSVRLSLENRATFVDSARFPVSLLTLTNSHQSMENPFLDKFQVLGDHPHPLRSNPPDSLPIDRPLSYTSEEPINAHEPDEDDDEDGDEDGHFSRSRLCTAW